MKLQNATVVITGASSGIGRATALEFAKEGANLVLASRSAENLNEVRRACETLGANARAVVTDVTKSEQVAKLAQKAAQAFGNRIDVWLNDPGIGVIGVYEDVPIRDHDRIIETNLLGYMHGCHAVLPYMKKQKSGVIINMNSLGAFMPSPYGASYTASKFGLLGFMDALRGELHAHRDIHICDVFPGMVNSPGVAHGANYSGVELKPIKPVIDPRTVARSIVKVAKQPKEKTLVGSITWLMRFSYAFAPKLSRTLFAVMMEQHMKNGKRVSDTDGILFRATPPHEDIDGHFDYRKQNLLIAGATASLALALGGFFAARAFKSKRNVKLRSEPRAQFRPEWRPTMTSVRSQASPPPSF